MWPHSITGIDASIAVLSTAIAFVLVVLARRALARLHWRRRLPASDWLMTYRPVAQMLSIFVLPEIDRRIASGTIAPTALPIPVKLLRVVQPGAGHRVELNEEVQLQLEVATRRAVKAGEPVTLGDIHPDKCALKPPEVDGKPAPYFLVQPGFLTLHVMFDFTQPIEGVPPIGEPAPPMKYDIASFIQMRSFLEAIKPSDKFQELADLNWPPAPGYFPGVVTFTHNNPALLKGPELADAVAKAYSPAVWAQRLAFWKEAKFFGARLPYVEKAVERYLAGDWISATYVLVPQFEGIIGDYLAAEGAIPHKEFRQQLSQLRQLILSRKILLFSRRILELVLTFIDSGTFWKNTKDIGDASQEVNRHGIAHGVFTGFESRDIALKHLVLLDGLALLLLHDKILTNKLS